MIIKAFKYKSGKEGARRLNRHLWKQEGQRVEWSEMRNLYVRDTEAGMRVMRCLKEGSKAEIVFWQTQLAGYEEFWAAKVESQVKVVERLKKGVAGGAESQKDLAAAQTDLRQPEGGVFARNHDMAISYQASAATQGGALNRGDQRLRKTSAHGE